MRLGEDLDGKRTSGFRLDCLLGAHDTEVPFDVGTCIALLIKQNWRATADEDGHYSFAVAL